MPHCMQVKTLNVAGLFSPETKKGFIDLIIFLGNELTGSDIQILLSKLEVRAVLF